MKIFILDFFSLQRTFFVQNLRTTLLLTWLGRKVFEPAEEFSEEQDFSSSNSFIHAEQDSTDSEVELNSLTKIQFLVRGVAM